MLIFKSLPAKMETMLYARLALVKCPVSIARHSPIWPITCSPVLQKVRVSIAVNVTMRVKCKLFAQQSASFEDHYKTINEHFLTTCPTKTISQATRWQIEIALHLVSGRKRTGK